MIEFSPCTSYHWYQAGVPIRFPYHGVHTNLNPTTPDDGLVYVRKQIVEPVQEPEEGQQAEAAADHQVFPEPQAEIATPKDMKAAFEERFGSQWLLKPEARTVLLGLLAETGRNYDITTYGAYVSNADVAKLQETLQSWGIDPNKV